MSLEDLTPQQRGFLALGEGLMKNPDIAKEARKLLRKADPNFRPPDLDLEERLETEREERRKENKALEDRLNTEQRNRWYEEQKRKVATAGLDLTKVEEVMKTKKIAEYDTAIEFLQSQQSPAAPTPEGVTPVARLPDNKELWKNPKQNASDLAHQMINEFRSKRIA